MDVWTRERDTDVDFHKPECAVLTRSDESQLIIAVTLNSNRVYSYVLEVKQDEAAETISVFRKGKTKPILVQNAKTFVDHVIITNGRTLMPENG